MVAIVEEWSPYITMYRNKNLLERVNTSSGRVDRGAGVIRDVQILGKRSEHGYEYSIDAMGNAESLLENARCYIDHPPRNDVAKSRSFREWAGVLKNVRYDPQRESVRGDLHLRKENPLYSEILEAADEFPDAFGLSMNAAGDVIETRLPGRSRKTVQSIKTVRSVDIVMNPATNKNLFESAENGGNPRKATNPEITKFLRSVKANGICDRLGTRRSLMESANVDMSAPPRRDIAPRTIKLPTLGIGPPVSAKYLRK